MSTKCWRQQVFLCIVLADQLFTIDAFNLDTQNVLKRNGEPQSLFGFSLALHHQLSPVEKKLLLVGAPHLKFLGKVDVTGGVYQCELNTESGDCQRIDFDDEAFLESREGNGQWMGVRVTSQGPGRSVMACAHRYQILSPSPDIPNLMTGQCYLLDQDLHRGTAMRQWRRVVCNAKHLDKRPKDHGWFAYCQQGHSASFAKDNSSLLLGAPGAYQWKGIVRMEPLDNLVVSSNEEPRETGDEDRFDPSLIPLLNNSYLGFALDSSMALTSKGQLTIVSGAPRGGYSGQVAFLKRDPVAERSLLVELVISGPGLASSFGYDLAVVDFNGDGWDDLAVGAPQFFMKDKDVGGALYVYINNKGTEWEKNKPLRFDGPKDSMFGLAVESVGDINQDGYGDVAVGAPYEGAGRVYLFYGSSNKVHIKAAQILTSESPRTTLFGYSLSGNLDVDDNNYPDLAVGSLSGSVFVYRARPVVSIREKLTLTPSEIDLAKQRCDQHTCTFTVKVCFSYSARPASYNPSLIVSYAIETDAERRKQRLPSRMVFLGQSNGVVELLGQGTEKCVDTQLRLLGDIKDRLHSVPISVSEALQSFSQTSGRSPLPPLSPVLDMYQQSKAITELKILNRGCGADNICQSNLELQYRFCSRQKQMDNEVCTSLPSDNGFPVISPADEDIVLEITVTNSDGDDAHQSHLALQLPDSLPFSFFYQEDNSEEVQVRCTANENGTLVDCQLGNPFKRDAAITLYVVLATSRISLRTTNVNVTLQLKTTSVQPILPIEAVAKVVFELHLQVFGQARPSQVYFGENGQGESAMKSEAEVGTIIEYEFRITNLGRPLKSFANGSLNIYWPKENSSGKRLLNLIQIRSSGVQKVPCSPESEINPVQRIKGLRVGSRNRRQGEQEPFSSQEGFIFLPTKRKYKTLTCSDEVKCVEIRCPLFGLDSSAVVVLQSRLWNRTFIEEYSSLNYLDIVVDATLSLTDSPPNIGLRKTEKSGAQVRLTVFPEKKPEYFAKVAWWIIFLTVMAGLLLLAVLGLLLWMCGCIKCPIHGMSSKYHVNTEETEPLK